MTNTIADRVREGLMYLLDRGYDEVLREVSIQNLVMNHHESCVLGQMFGEYADGLEILGVAYDDAYDLGFNGRPTDMAALTAEWRKALSDIDNYLYGGVLNHLASAPPKAKPAAVGMVNGNLVLRTGSGQHVVLPLNNDGYFNLDVLNALANANK